MKKKDEVKVILSKKAYKTTCTVLGVLAKVMEVMAIIGAITCGICGVILGLSYRSVDLKSAVDELTANAQSYAQMPISVNMQKEWLDNFFAKGQGEQLAIILGCIALVAIMLAIISTLAHHVSQFFRNLAQKRTPFMLDNVNHLQKIAIWIFVAVGYSMLAEIVIPLFFGISNVAISISVDLIAVGFAAMVLAVIFKRGYDMESGTKE